MKQIFGFILPAITIVVFSFSVVISFDTTALAVCDTSNLNIKTGADCAHGRGQPAELFAGDASVFSRVTNVLLFIIGAIAVIMLIIGGIRYVVSGGDQNQVTAAKNTILYAIIGIIVAVLAYAAVRFVLTTLLNTTA